MSDEPKVTVLPPTIKQAGDPRKDATWTLMPVSPELCSQCARDHEPWMPHDQETLFYKFAFYSEHNRWPTWADAMAHCDEEVKQVTIAVLRENGVEIEDAAPRQDC